MVKTVLSLLLILSLAACASSGDMNYMRQDINDLQRNSYDMQNQLKALQKKTDAAAKELGTLKTGRKGSLGAVQESQAEINSRLTEISEGLQSLRGRFEENKYYVDKALKEAGTDRDLMKTQIQGLQAQVNALSAKLGGGTPAAAGTPTPQPQPQVQTPQGPEGTPSPTPAPSGTGVAPKAEKSPAVQPQPSATPQKKVENARVKAYNDAYQSFKDKNYKDARRKFEAFIKDYPKNDLTDNAQFWIGETYYAEKDYEGAILAYETLLKKYPDSAKTSAALLKQGLAFIEIGDPRTGTIILRNLIEKYPDSKEAKIARKKIAALEKKPGSKK